MKTWQWQQQSIVVTGASGGLGRELVRQLSERGARVLMVARSADKLETLAQTYQQPYLALDITAPDAATTLLEFVQKEKFAVTGLINNAAQNWLGTFASATTEQIDALLNSNLLAPMRLTHAMLPLLRQRQGWLLNVGSAFGAIGYPGQTLYCASKFGLHGFSQSLARECAGTGVTVMYTAPRAIATEMNQGLMAAMNERLGTATDNADWVASQILEQIAQQQTERNLGWPEKLFIKINSVFPSWVASAMRKPQRVLLELMQEKSL